MQGLMIDGTCFPSFLVKIWGLHLKKTCRLEKILKKNKSKVVFSELVVLDFIVKLEIEICAILLLKFYVKITWSNQLHFFC